MTRKTGYMVTGPGVSFAEYSIRPEFAVGQLVVTPLNRIAKVLGEDTEGRLRLMYQDCDPRDAVVALFPKLLRAANEATQIGRCDCCGETFYSAIAMDMHQRDVNINRSALSKWMADPKPDGEQ